MLSKACRAAAMLPVAFVTTVMPASAQGLETLGTRASALSAFVAVADDASAVAWNPAGLVSGPIFNVQIDLGRWQQQPDDPPHASSPAAKLGTTLVALGTTPVGVGYYRLAQTSFEVVDPAAGAAADRQIRRVQVRTLVTSHLGVTVQQSIGEYLTVGSTLKLVRGSVGSGVIDADSWETAFDRADLVEGEGNTRGDLDVGAMVAGRAFRAGVVVRNLTAPRFGAEESDDSVALERHVRVGMAWGDRWPGISRTVLAVDADLTRVPHPAGERRDIAAGVERWWRSQRIGIRGGVRVSTLDAARPVVSVGGSYAVRAGTYVDLLVAGGDDAARAWGIAARLTF